MILFDNFLSEKEVEHFWWSFITEYFPNGTINARNNSNKTDGLFIDNSNDLHTLIEVKYDLELSKSSERAKVLIQSIFYIKEFETKGQKLPKTVFIADKNEAFVIHTNALLKYLDYKIDWKTAPSQAYKNFPDMMIDITNDNNINPFVFKIVKGFNFNAIKNKLIELNQNVSRLIKITDDNIQSVYEYFIDNVLIDKKLSINQQVNLFIDLIINTEDNYLHTKKKNTIVSKSFGYVSANENNFISFFEHYDGDQYTIREKEKMVSIIDRMVEDETRKKQGEFFTPTIWVNEAHKMISEQFGEDWKEKYVVWDCAWGTGNLTRDYKFKELYCSTLNDSDIQTANQMKINMEATKFQFDFLNDDLELLKEPDYATGLYKALQEGKEIIFLINPPYGTNGEGVGSGTSKKGISETKISYDMKIDDWGSTQQLYAQFLYRISKIKNSKICLFSPPLFLSSGSYNKFRKKFFEKFKFDTGYLINASNFADVSNWGLSFTIWENGKEINTSFDLIVKEIKDTEITNDIKNIYNIDDTISFSDYIKRNIKNIIKKDCVQMTSALKYVPKGKGKLSIKSLGYFDNKSNSVMYNTSEVYLLSSSSSRNQGISILPINFLDVISNFTARKLIKSNWINQKDEYIAPTEQVLNDPEYIQWNNDAIIHSLFNTSSNQSSMRQVDYKDKKWDIKNEFFFMSKDDMMNLSEEYFFDDIYQDARSSDERYVYTLLQNTNLSQDAQELLDMSKELIKKSFKMRKFIHEEHPEYHLNTWDAGWYQIKIILKEYFKEDYKIFTNKYKDFEDRIRPYVYKFGFLK
ncbi:hypothetical protein M0Q50_01050 [bacterium]|jgi:hypothetical protein|nr:hypothetical protein [bacterium]